MITFKNLYDSTLKYRRWARFYPDVKAKLIGVIPNIRAKLLTFRFRVQSVSKINEGYNVFVQFYNVDLSSSPDSSNAIKLINPDTQEVFYLNKRISITDATKQNWVRVRCSCFDFRFRFAWEDRDVNALYGPRPARYQRKAGSTRPPVNPEHIPGMCKHIYWCVKEIERYFTR